MNLNADVTAAEREATVLRRHGSVLLQWLRFAAVGASNTLLSWCVYAALVTLGVPYLLGSGLAFAAGSLNSYVLNRRWTFRSRARRVPEVLRFAVVQCVGLGVDVSLLDALARDAHVHHLIAQALVFPVASGLTFVLSRQWAFAGARAPAYGPPSVAGSSR